MFLDLEHESVRSRRGSWLHDHTDQHREGRGCSLPLTVLHRGYLSLLFHKETNNKGKINAET